MGKDLFDARPIGSDYKVLMFNVQEVMTAPLPIHYERLISHLASTSQLKIRTTKNARLEPHVEIIIM
jgi:hypothetical protein